MKRAREITWRIGAVLRRRRLDGETRAEMRFHLDMETAAGMARTKNSSMAAPLPRNAFITAPFRHAGYLNRSVRHSNN